MAVRLGRAAVCIGEANMVDGEAFMLVYEIVLANHLSQADLLPMIAKALGGSGAAIQLRVAAET